MRFYIVLLTFCLGHVVFAVPIQPQQEQDDDDDGELNADDKLLLQRILQDYNRKMEGSDEDEGNDHIAHLDELMAQLLAYYKAEGIEPFGYKNNDEEKRVVADPYDRFDERHVNFQQQASKRYFDSIGSALLSHKRNFQSRPLPSKRYLETIGTGLLPSKRYLESIGDGLLPSKRYLESIGDGLLPSKRYLESIGHGLLPTKRYLESIGSGLLPAKRRQEGIAADDGEEFADRSLEDQEESKRYLESIGSDLLTSKRYLDSIGSQLLPAPSADKRKAISSQEELKKSDNEKDEVSTENDQYNNNKKLIELVNKLLNEKSETSK